MDERDLQLMRSALEQARLAETAGEVPVGAVVTWNGEVIGQAHNRVILDHDPSAHAEVLALRQAGQRMLNYRMPECTMYVTVEPCAMCAGALVHSRMQRLVYGASDPKAGAVISVMQVLNHPRLNHRMEVVSGVLAAECSAILQEFFRKRRTAGI